MGARIMNTADLNQGTHHAAIVLQVWVPLVARSGDYIGKPRRDFTWIELGSLE